MTDLLFVITDLAVGGAENQVQDLASRFAAQGWRVAVVSMMPPIISTQRLSDAGVEVEHLSIRRGSWDPRAVERLRVVIRRRRPRIVHSHMVHANLLVRAVRPISPIPVLVCTSHSVGLEGRVKEALLRITDRVADLTTHVSRAGLTRYQTRGIVSSLRAEWVPNGVDVQRFGRSRRSRDILRAELGVPDDEFLWLAVGAFRPMKAFDGLVQTFTGISANAQLVLVGDGPEREEIEHQIEVMALQRRVTLLGIRNDVGDLMHAADAFVLASTTGEALPLVLLEAAASNLPIVTTDVGGCNEVVLDGVNGIVVPPSNSAALKKAMLDMMALPVEDRHAMGGRGRAHVTEQFDIERVVSRWENIYRTLLAQRRL